MKQTHNRRGNRPASDGHAAVLRRSAVLWYGAAIVTGFNVYASNQHSLSVLQAALMATGAFALGGIAFGIWAGRRLA